MTHFAEIFSFFRKISMLMIIRSCIVNPKMYIVKINFKRINLTMKISIKLKHIK